jgi:tetratricopeptide (TPR) repeat protein
LFAAVALLALAAGCSGSASPVNRLKARVQLKEGNRSYLAGRYEEAILRYDRALGLVPQLAPAHLNRAYSQEALSRLSGDLADRQKLASEAVSSFEQYIGLIDHGAAGVDAKAPSRERIEEHILSLLVDSQQVDRAIAHLKARFERNPRDLSALEMLSRLEMESGRMDEALEWQRKRVAAEPQDPDGLYSLGAFAWLMSFRDSLMEPTKRQALLDEGMAALERAVEIQPDHFDALIYINLIYRQKAIYAVKESERAAFEAQANVYRTRALALRPETSGTGGADSSRAAESDSAQASHETP